MLYEFEGNFHVASRTFHGVPMRMGPFIHKLNAVIHGYVTEPCSPAYEVQHSVITVVPRCTHSLPTTTNVAVVLSYTCTRKVLPDSLSTPPNTQ
jgi:hypothetical protein